MSMLIFGGIITLLAASLWLSWMLWRQDKNSQGKSQQTAKRLSELEAILAEKERDLKQKTTQLEEAKKDKSEGEQKRIMNLDAQLKSTLVKLDDELKLKGELAEKNRGLQNEIARLNKELGLKTQMYDGLKSQYEELEKNSANPPKKEEAEGEAQPPQNPPINEI